MFQALIFLWCLPFITFGLTQRPIGEDVEVEYTIYRSEISDHTIRIKPQNDSICDAQTKQWTGWLSAGSKHLFFWYFDIAPQSPNKDSLTLWLTGGPGSSSMIALFGENGPCLIADKGASTKYNPFGWTQATSMLFLDQPAGVGFSYYDQKTPMPDNSFTGAEDMTAFLHIFLSQVFPEKAKVPFHISGESYGGHYIPTLAAEISRQNIAYPDRPHIMLKSILVGNGFMSPSDGVFGYWETLCTTKPGVKTPVFNSTRCDAMAEAMPRCMKLIQACYKVPDVAICNAAFAVCYGEVMGWYDDETGDGGRNRFDITRTCDTFPYCYKFVDHIESYLNSGNVWETLAIPSAVKRFNVTNEEINHAFSIQGDVFYSTERDLQYLLSQGINVLIYQGNLDLACNTAGNLHMANNMYWRGHVEFQSKQLTPWSTKVDGKEKIVGTHKEVNVKMKGVGKTVRFAFVTVNDAGHMVPWDQPEATLNLLNRWIRGESFENKIDASLKDYHYDL